MNYTPIQTTTYGGLDGGKPRWEARTQLGLIDASTRADTEKEAVTILKELIARHTGKDIKEIEDPDWKQTDDMFGANYKPTSEATFGFKEYGYYVDKDGNGKIGVLPK